jgi:transposase InsO family protein
VAPDVTGFFHDLHIFQWDLRLRVTLYRKPIGHKSPKKFQLDLFEVFTQEWDAQVGTMGRCRERGSTMAMQSRKSPSRAKVRERLALLAYVKVHGIAPAAQRFGLDRKTERAWRDRYCAHGEAGLVPRYPTRRPRRIPAETVELIAHARTEFRYGACRTRLWLIRVHERAVATRTITRICEDLGLPPLQRVKRRRTPRQLTLFEKPNPGDSVQVDVKVVKLAGTKAYQYTACDDCTRYRVLRLYRHLDQRSSLDFLAEAQRRLPFTIRRVQTDHGTEFAFAFVLAVEQAGMQHRYIRPRCPQQNGKVERSHRIDAEEFRSRHEFAGFDEAAPAARDWEQVYNYQRFSMALHGRTPAEKLAAVLQAA